MREILFRGKRVDNGEWVYGNLIEDKWGDDNGNTIYAILQDRVAPEIAALWTPVKVVPETVGEYTGLKGKNGKKIFEGDIIRTSGYYDKEIGVIRRGEYDVYSRFVFGGYYCVDKTSALIDWTSSRSCEVVGNVFDNKLEDFR